MWSFWCWRDYVFLRSSRNVIAKCHVLVRILALSFAFNGYWELYWFHSLECLRSQWHTTLCVEYHFLSNTRCSIFHPEKIHRFSQVWSVWKRTQLKYGVLRTSRTRRQRLTDRHQMSEWNDDRTKTDLEPTTKKHNTKKQLNSTWDMRMIQRDATTTFYHHSSNNSIVLYQLDSQ